MNSVLPQLPQGNPGTVKSISRNHPLENQTFFLFMLMLLLFSLGFSQKSYSLGCFEINKESRVEEKSQGPVGAILANLKPISQASSAEDVKKNLTDITKILYRIRQGQRVDGLNEENKLVFLQSAHQVISPPIRSASLGRYVTEPGLSSLWMDSVDAFVLTVREVRDRLPETLSTQPKKQLKGQKWIEKYDPYQDFLKFFSKMEGIAKNLPDETNDSASPTGYTKSDYAAQVANLMRSESFARMLFHDLGTELDSPVAFLNRWTRISRMGFSGEAQEYLEAQRNASEIHYSNLSPTSGEVPLTQIVERTDKGSFQINFPFKREKSLVRWPTEQDTKDSNEAVASAVQNFLWTYVTLRLSQYHQNENGSRVGGGAWTTVGLQSLGHFFIWELAYGGKADNPAAELLRNGVTISGDFSSISPTDNGTVLAAIAEITKLQITNKPGLMPMDTSKKQILQITGKKKN